MPSASMPIAAVPGSRSATVVAIAVTCDGAGPCGQLVGGAPDDDDQRVRGGQGRVADGADLPARVAVGRARSAGARRSSVDQRRGGVELAGPGEARACPGGTGESGPGRGDVDPADGSAVRSGRPCSCHHSGSGDGTASGAVASGVPSLSQA